MSTFINTLQRLKSDGLPVITLAGILHSDRKTVCGWLAGGLEDADASRRLALIHPLLDKAFGGNPKTIHRLWNTRDREGRSLGDLLSAEIVDIEMTAAYLELFAPAIRRYAAQDAAPSVSVHGRNPLIDGMPTVDFGDR